MARPVSRSTTVAYAEYFDHRAAQNHVRLIHVGNDLVAGAREKLARDGFRNVIGQLVASGDVCPRGNRDGLHGLRDQVGLAGDVIAAGGSALYSDKELREPLHKYSFATATAFSAVSRRLSATTQNQHARGLLRSTRIAPTLKPLWPTEPMLEGGSSGLTSSSAALQRLLRAHPFLRFFKLRPHRKTIAVKYGHLNHSQRRHGDSGPGRKQRSQMPLQALLNRFERLHRLLAVAWQTD